MGNLMLHFCSFFVKDRQHSIFPCSPSGVNMRTNLPDISIIENSHCIMILQAMLSIMQYFNLQLISLCGASLTASGLQLLVSNSYCIVNEFRFADGHQTSLLLLAMSVKIKKSVHFKILKTYGESISLHLQLVIKIPSNGPSVIPVLYQPYELSVKAIVAFHRESHLVFAGLF